MTKLTGWVDLTSDGIMVEIESYSTVPVVHVAETEEIARLAWIPASTIKGVLTRVTIPTIVGRAMTAGHKLVLYGSKEWIERVRGPVPEMVVAGYVVDARFRERVRALRSLMAMAGRN